MMNREQLGYKSHEHQEIELVASLSLDRHGQFLFRDRIKSLIGDGERRYVPSATSDGNAHRVNDLYRFVVLTGPTYLKSFNVPELSWLSPDLWVVSLSSGNC